MRTSTRGKAFIAFTIIATLLLGLMITLPLTTGAGAKGANSRSKLQASALLQKNGIQVTKAANKAAFISGDYTLQSVEIDGTDAHLRIFPNPFSPVLTFSFTTMHGMTLSHPMTATTSLVISSTADATSTNVAIKTSVLHDLVTALGSFTDKADLLVLIAGGTVHHLVMKNVTLKIDSYLNAQNLTVPGLQLQVVNN